MIKTRFGYTLLLWAMLPAAIIRLFWRARRQPAYASNISERLGFYRRRPETPLIWLHAVSVGETRAAEPLIRALQREYPRHRILLTHMTPSGRETGEALYGDSILRCYLPYDFPFAVRRFLDHFRPVAGALVETEIWFNLIHQCRMRGTPVYLVSARLSHKSAARYARFGALVRAGLQELTAIAAQTEDDAQRLRALGATNVQVCGNLKFDIGPPPAMLALGRQWRASYGERRVLLAASSRDGEEELLLDALAVRYSDTNGSAVASRPGPTAEQLGTLDPLVRAPGESQRPSIGSLPGDFLLVIVPRHPQRFDDIAALLEKRGIRYQRRSENRDVSCDTRVLLGDSMGELFAYYAACDVAFVGGSLLPFGGQNLIEACAVGVPAVVGPHTYNFSEATRAAVAAGAAVQVENAEALLAAANDLFEDVERIGKMGEAGRTFAAQHRGATAKLLALIQW